jgi:hypothetical protein
MRRLFDDALGWGVPAWLEEAEQIWAEPPPPDGPRVAVAIWRDPWMVVGGDTFTGDVVARLGWQNVFGDRERYPRVELADIDRDDVDLVLLPDEPYVFGPHDGPEAFTRASTALVPGRLLTWYGPSLVTARGELGRLG